MRLRTSSLANLDRPARFAVAPRPGIASIEFAVLATLLGAMTLGMSEVSRGIRAKAVMIDAARTGCRMALLPGSSNSSVTTGMNSILTDNSLTSSNATFTFKVNGVVADVNTAKQNDKISVTVSYPVNRVFASTLFIPLSGNFVETVVMMRQG